MKKQNFIAYLYNTDGKQVNFERLPHKTIKGATFHMKTLCSMPLYRCGESRGALCIKIFATPDGVNPVQNPAAVFTVDAFNG